MALKILTAPPASGKTKACVQRVLDTRKKHPDAQLWVLVPDGLQASAFRLRLAREGGGLGVHVVTFNHFLREILEITGNSLPSAPAALIKAFIRKAIEITDQNAGIDYYSNIKHMPGFISVLEERFEELKRGMIYPQDFLEFADCGPKPIKELSRLYEAYQSLLTKENYGDAEGFSWLAVEFLEQNPDWTPDWPILVLDGFDSFTQPQLKALNLLSDRIDEIFVTLPGTSDMSRRAHRRFADTLDKLRDLPMENVLCGGALPDLSLPLGQLESRLGEMTDETFASEGIISMIEVQSQLDEVRETLRWLKARILLDGIEIQNCALILPDLSPYKLSIQAVADEFGLPVEFSVGEALVDTPVFAALKTLLSIWTEDFPRRLVIDILRSPYFNLMVFGFEHQDAEILDLVSQSRSVVSGKAVWVESLVALEFSEKELNNDEDYDLPVPSIPNGKKISRIRQAVAEFFDWLDPGKEKKLLLEWISWLEDSLDKLEFWQNSGSQSDINATAAFRQMIRDQVLAEEVVGGQVCTYDEFLDLLVELAKITEVVEQRWPRPPAIKVLRTIEGRGLRHEAVAILGLSEGIFPRPQKADPFLGEDIREALGLDSAFDKYQLGIFYQSVTRSNHKLLLTRPFLAPDGEPWEPSPFWEAVSKLIPDALRRITTNLDRKLWEAGSTSEVLTWATLRGSISPRIKKDIGHLVERIQAGKEILKSRITPNALSEYDGDLAVVSDLVRAKYGYGSIWSVSRLESYTKCPFFYFASSVLRLQAKREPDLGMDIAQRGTILHIILEQTYKEADDPTDLDELLATVERIADDVLGNAPNEYGFRPTQMWEQEKFEIKTKLKDTITALIDLSIGWDPIGFEASFGMDENSALLVKLDRGEIYLRGLIDRVDRNKAGDLRIIDYKTGSSNLSAKDLNDGVRLQLPLYALAARDALGMGEPVDGFYWAILQAKRGGLSLQKYGFEEAVGKALEHSSNVLDGVENADFKPITPNGGCPGYCPAANWCWAYDPKGSW